MQIAVSRPSAYCTCLATNDDNKAYFHATDRCKESIIRLHYHLEIHINIHSLHARSRCQNATPGKDACTHWCMREHLKIKPFHTLQYVQSRTRTSSAGLVNLTNIEFHFQAAFPRRAATGSTSNFEESYFRSLRYLKFSGLSKRMLVTRVPLRLLQKISTLIRS